MFRVDFLHLKEVLNWHIRRLLWNRSGLVTIPILKWVRLWQSFISVTEGLYVARFTCIPIFTANKLGPWLKMSLLKSVPTRCVPPSVPTHPSGHILHPRNVTATLEVSFVLQISHKKTLKPPPRWVLLPRSRAIGLGRAAAGTVIAISRERSARQMPTVMVTRTPALRFRC